MSQHFLDADVVCLQEVAPESFEDDFQFMQGLGYDGVELYRKGRFRPATFWKKSKCHLVAPAVHKDRSLLTAFRIVENGEKNENPPWYVLNCHLQAGKEGKRRVRQIQEGTKAIVNLAKKLKGMNAFVCLSTRFPGSTCLSYRERPLDCQGNRMRRFQWRA